MIKNYLKRKNEIKREKIQKMAIYSNKQNTIAFFDKILYNLLRFKERGKYHDN